MPNEEVTQIETVECSWCGESTPVDGPVVLGYGLFCPECASNYACTCGICSDIIHSDDAYHIENYNSTVCGNCYSEWYFHCEGCEVSWHVDSMSGYDPGYCQDCSGDDGEYTSDGIRRWGDRPELRFHSSVEVSYTPLAKQYYMGMEIELEESGHIVGEVMHKVEEHMWATTDASLYTGGGVEIVTHPHTLEAWNDTFPWDMWERDIHSMVPDQEPYNSNGIHIHVSRSAFNNDKGRMIPSHLYKFMQFIQVNQDPVQRLAGREGNNYCQWGAERDAVSRLSDAKPNTSMSNMERYRPINTQNPTTIELRFFAGLSDPAFMRRSLHFVHSLVEFTRKGNFKSDRSWKAYVGYVRSRALRYPELAAYLNENATLLDAHATIALNRYTLEIKPRIKEQIRQKRAAAMRREQELIAEAAARQALIDNPPLCPCYRCIADRELG